MLVEADSFGSGSFVYLYMDAGNTTNESNDGSDKWLAFENAGCLELQLCGPPLPPTGLPEPGSLALLGLGLAAAGWRRRRK